MFQFTTTNIVNTPWWNGYIPGEDESFSYDPKDDLHEHALFTAEKGHFYVKGVNDFLTENIVSVYKAEGYASEKAKLVIDFSKVQDGIINSKDTNEAGDIFRLNIYIGLSQGSNDAMYANDTYFKGKPFMIDFRYSGDWEEDLKKLEKTIKRYGLDTEGEKMLVIKAEGDTLTLTAVNEYQRFKRYSLEKLDNRAYQGMGDWIPVENAQGVKAEDVYQVTEGKEGFGTYSWILHNLRIPTSARNDMFSPNYEETPVVGGIYDQYTIHYCKNRGSLGLNAVGDQTMSHTTHVFYVLRKDKCDDNISEDFQAALEEACSGASFEAETRNEDANFTEPVIYKLDPKKATQD